MHNLLQGAVDLHIHAGPSVARREVDAGDMVKTATEFGYRAFVVKDHYFPTMMSATLVEKHLGNSGVKVFGGICLNNSVGGINLKAVDAAYGMGAKFVCMPTVSAYHHAYKHQGGHFLGAGALTVKEKLITYINEQGDLLPEVMEVLRFVAERPDLILYTGHGSLPEVDAVITQAVKAGVKNILVNHPFYLVDAGIDDMVRWSKLGAYIEINAVVFRPTKPDRVPIDIAEKILANISLDKIILDSDYGQKGNGSPAEGIYAFSQRLIHEAGASAQQISVMLKRNPARLLGLD
ncbi:MAG: DUF6282 family protein [Sporomusaceae bacterium]|nr:DUF6282 family protein [Sporomusaceae bacterium]